ncbi:MAG: very short patch repair endonuclease [Egibacteraceae bacterium]
MADSFASSPQVRARMQRQRRRDTGLELAVRRELHRRGLRYRLHRRPLPELRREADIVFPTAKVAVFADSCFWHACPDHGMVPAANATWWAAKFQRTVARDAETTKALEAAGWTVVRVWEHENPTVAADVIAAIVRAAVR